jgi:LDH2 family malate/lactate/ureidoglycolate dehydrogenase
MRWRSAAAGGYEWLHKGYALALMIELLCGR